jgi:hypothetical protein
MPLQRDLIGIHPSLPNIFAKWFNFNDVPVTATKTHRALIQQLPNKDKDLIDWLGRKIFEHHHSSDRTEKLKENYSKLGYSKYAEQHRKLPRVDKVKKGNATEIILIEYVQSSLNKQLYHTFKLRYNPNVDQAIKGDDTLMVDVYNEKGIDKVKMYLGEAKFRKTPTKTVVDTISKSLSKDKRPLSYSFLVDELGRDPMTKGLADILETFIVEEIKGKGDLVYTGFLLSNADTFKTVESTLNSDNSQMILISVGIDNPEELITEGFNRAEYFFANPDKL